MQNGKITRVRQWIRNDRGPAVFTIVIVAVVAIVLLFIPPVNGLADNGEYIFTLNNNRLFIQNPESYPYADFFQSQYGIRQFYYSFDRASFSTSYLFIRLAVWLNQLLFSSTTFDMRFLAFLYLIAYLPALYLLARGITHRMTTLRGYLMGGLIALVLGDGAVLIYFNSFYPEATALIGLIYFVGSVLYFVRVRRARYLLLVLVLLSILLIVGASARYYMMIIGCLITVAGLSIYTKKRAEKVVLLLLGIFALSGTVAAGLFAKNPNYQTDLYNSVTLGLINQNERAGAILGEGGVNRQYRLLEGTTAYYEYVPLLRESDQFQREFYGPINYFLISQGYSENPGQLLKVLQQALEDSYLVKPNEVGNYTKHSQAEARQQSRFFTLFNTISRSIFPKEIGFFFLLMFVYAVLYSIGFYNGVLKNQRWLKFRLFLILGMIVNFFLVLLVAVAYSGDSDLIRHAFLGSIYNDLLFLITIGDLLGKRFWDDRKEVTG